jgi:hypothetical protein
MVTPLENLFPRLRVNAFRITSPADDDYNCIAWAAGKMNDWWWPLGDPDKSVWPSDARREETVPAFRDVFASLGYAVCSNEEVESGYEKVALFATEADVPTHAARQLLNGRWTSKLGFLEDIEHKLHDLEGTEYGSVVLIMKRSISPISK